MANPVIFKAGDVLIVGIGEPEVKDETPRYKD
jgi:hypothetical protein